MPDIHDPKAWKVYIVECSDGSLYTGITKNIKKRVAKHNNGTGSRYTRGRRPVKIKIWKAFGSISLASRAEVLVKKQLGDKKISFLNNL